MFNQTTNIAIEQRKHVNVKNQAQQQVLEMRVNQSGHFIVKCRMDDQIWQGLFYDRPFLNQTRPSRGYYSPVQLIEGSLLQQGDQSIIDAQRVIVHSVKILDKSKLAFVEVSWDDSATPKQ